MAKTILKNIKHVCFDLDGTLVDSYLNIYKATIKTLEVLKIPGSFSNEEFYSRIGHHFLDIFKDLKIPVPDIEHFINVYKSFYFEFIGDSTLYPGVLETLEFLKKEGIYVSLLTTKGQDQADKIIEHFNLSHFFSHIMGRRIGVPIKPLPEPLLMICHDLNVRPAETLITGDTELDIRCGKSAGTRTCGVTHGYRTREILSLENPDFVIDEIWELME